MPPAALILLILGGLAGLAVLALAAFSLLFFAWRSVGIAPAGTATVRVAPVEAAGGAGGGAATSNPRPGTLGRIGPVTLAGPGGNRVRLPLDGPAIVHVWLQACPDCMPAFEAVKRMARDQVELPCPVVNVAYGSASPEWAAEYGVNESLVLDATGSAVVSPLGIGTFTTLVLDADGGVHAIEYPHQDGYLERIRAAARAAGAEVAPPAEIPAEREK